MFLVPLSVILSRQCMSINISSFQYFVVRHVSEPYFTPLLSSPSPLKLSLSLLGSDFNPFTAMMPLENDQ